MKLIRTKTSAKKRPGFGSSNEVSISDLARDAEFVATANVMIKIFGKSKSRLSGVIRSNKEAKPQSYGKFRLVYRGPESGATSGYRTTVSNAPYAWSSSIAPTLPALPARASRATSDLEPTPEPQGTL